MYPTYHLKEKLLLFIKIFLPLVIYQLANFSASFVDTMMTGQYSTIDLAGLSMGTSLWNPFFNLLTGLVSALVPIIGQHLGRGQKDKIGEEVYQFIYLGLLLSLGLTLIVWLGAIPALTFLDLAPEVLAVGQSYLRWLSLGILPLILFSVFRSFFDAIGLTRLSMYLMLLILPFNTFFNYSLIYGRFGFPEMGGAGAGLGTALAYWALLVVVGLVLRSYSAIKPYNLAQVRPFNMKLIRSALSLGLPIGLQIFAEVAIFAVMGLFMAKFSSVVIAGHQAAMSFITLFYAFPLSVSQTLAIMVSYEIGGRRHQDARQYSQLGRVLSICIAFFTVTFIYLFRQTVAKLYGSDPQFIEMAAVLLTYGLFFQVGDAFTAPLQGILRGYKDTRLPFAAGVVTYWGVALPLALLLDYLFAVGPATYWIGLTAGIIISGFVLHFRLRKIAERY